MRLIVVTDRRFKRTPDNVIWSTSSSDYPFWSRYLDVFEQVLIVGRTEMINVKGPHWKMVEGPNITVLQIPNYMGVSGFALSGKKTFRILLQHIDRNDAVILRIPGHLSMIASKVIKRKKMIYGAEVVGNPSDMFAPGVINHPLRPLIRLVLCRRLRRQCLNASSISYVTSHALQRVFPPSPSAFLTNYSSIYLPDEMIAAEPRKSRISEGSIDIVSVGSMELRYKGFDVLLKAVALCVDKGHDITLKLIGGGRQQKNYKNFPHGLCGRVVFTGELPGSSAVRGEMEKADLFILASRTEGLPRVIIEAMSAGLPCISTIVGGTPELLPREDLVPAGDPKALADKIHEVLSDPYRMGQMSERNIDTARQYTDSRLRKRRKAMYSELKKATLESALE